MRIILISLISLWAVISSAQESAPDFPYMHWDMEQEQLSDLRGEVIYVSFWASWCQPCLRNFKKYEEVRKQLAAEGVVLLNVNIDEDEALWRQTTEAQSIYGTNVMSTDFEQLQDDYQIYNVPLYEIINKRGEKVYLGAEGNRDIVGRFKQWLSE